LASDRVTATVTRMGDTQTYCFATDDWGREYFVHKKNVSAIGAKGWDWIAATLGDYVVSVEGVAVEERAGKWILLEVRVL
jgi:hypothetical protein